MKGDARKQDLEDLGREYQRADEKGRRRLLDEAEKRTGLNRKYLIRVLSHPHRAVVTGVDRGLGYFQATVRTADGGGAEKRAGPSAETRGVALQ
jgi:hypothetical protein